MKKIVFCALVAVQANALSLSDAQIHAIGTMIWQNESNGTIDGLVFWNSNEAYPSLGIGHFIWFPEGYQGTMEQTFPELIRYIKQQGTRVPLWIEQAIARGCPWKNREEFLSAGQAERIHQLKDFLAQTIDLQARFIISRFEQSLIPIKNSSSTVNAHAERLLADPRGIVAMIDYLNFKGSGLVVTERYNGYGWGLVQVLEMMHQGTDPIADFVASAQLVLKRRVDNSPNKAREQQWLPGWLNRVNRYAH